MRRMLTAILAGTMLCTSLCGCTPSPEAQGRKSGSSADGRPAENAANGGAGSGALWSVGFGSAELVPDD